MNPLPEAIARHIALTGANASANRSLLFDKAPKPDRNQKEWKQTFFATFAGAYRQHESEFDSFIARRKELLAEHGSHEVRIVSSTRIIVGHGLPHSARLGFHFDRLRGVPTFPGSTVKGLLREISRVTGQLDRADASRIFGEHTRRGELIVEDAFPETWPALEVDILTPHYTQYYEQGEEPGDWFEPKPVPFLTLKAPQPFLFWFSGCTPSELATIEQLLRLGLDWLGIGGKKSSGYGRFFEERPVPEKTAPKPAAPAPPAEQVWPDARLTYAPNNGLVTASWNGKTASAKFEKTALPEAFTGRREGTATVAVIPFGNTFKIVSIHWPE